MSSAALASCAVALATTFFSSLKTAVGTLVCLSSGLNLLEAQAGSLRLDYQDLGNLFGPPLSLMGFLASRRSNAWKVVSRYLGAVYEQYSEMEN